ncbi:MAG TPA: tetratricopeptide repeat protein [Pirellulales bacterium]|nr:tetratricopeptide repeat protein [Pirellulales bacterium]
MNLGRSWPWVRAMAVALLAGSTAWAADVPPAVKTPTSPAEAATADEIAALIGQLGDDDYFARQRAQERLAKIGFEAFDALSEAENHDDVEIASRARYLVRSMQVDWVAADDPAEVKSLLADYDAQGPRERAALVKQLAALADDKGLPALCRMVRFEKSPPLSKQAALALMSAKSSDDQAWNRRAAALGRGIGRSARPAAGWIRNYLASRSDPAAAADQWGRWAASEEKLVRESPQQTQLELAAALWRQQVVLLRRLDRRDEAVAAMMKVVALEQGSSDETLFELLAWLTEQQAWQIVDEVARRYAARIDANPLLLYALAETRQVQGQEAAANELADRAAHAKQIAGSQEAHIGVYLALLQHHMHRWIPYELRQIIEIGPPTSYSTMICQSILADLLHDRGDELAAAKLLEDAIQSIEANAKAGNEAQNNRLEPDRMRARLNYYRACDLASPNDRDKRIEHLKQALDADPTDADVLIALYRTPDLDAELRQRTMRLIKEAGELFRTQMQQDADDSMPCNQLAWLIANTEGDQQEALRCSQRSLELKPNEPGYLDTLGRCYYALGDFENAVKTQSQAVELNPHSGLMRKQLALFREALAKRQAEQKP